jgi:hypothetical protein
MFMLIPLPPKEPGPTSNLPQRSPANRPMIC